MSTNHKPAEPILLSTPIGLDSLGAKFTIDAPFSACRLCGSIYQSDQDRLARTYLESGRLVERFNVFTRESTFEGDDHAIAILDQSTEKRARWRRLHERRYHSDTDYEKQVARLHQTGFAFTPEAANKLAPFGITPLGFLSQQPSYENEVADALYSAPRAPINDAED